MQKLALIAGTLAILSIPAVSGPATSEKPLVVAEEGGISVSVGDRDHDRDRHKVVEIKHHDRDDDHHRKVVEIRHHDRDDDYHHKVVVIKHHDHDDDHDHDHH